jgi:hypothetical protein
MAIGSYVRLCIEQTIQNRQYGFTVCPSCGNGQYHLGGGTAKTGFPPLCRFEQFADAAPIVQCEKCDSEYCYKDKILWTADHDCVDYGSATGKLPQNVKPCPTCGARVSYYYYCSSTPRHTLIRDVFITAQVPSRVSRHKLTPGWLE